MTRDEILAMKPGRELDMMVAIQLFGWKWFWPQPGYCAVFTSPETAAQRDPERLFESPPDGARTIALEYPHYSTSIADAWAVVDKMSQCLWWLEGVVGPNGGLPWSVCFRNCVNAETIASADADSAPEAICKAALLAVAA